MRLCWIGVELVFDWNRCVLKKLKFKVGEKWNVQDARVM